MNIFHYPLTYLIFFFFTRHVNFDVVKAILIASPGFVRQQFFDYMYAQVMCLLKE